MSTNETSGLCLEVAESLSEILDGSASARLYDHLADCDACRDLRHEATNAAAQVTAAGADFRPGADFVEKLVGRLDAARPENPVAGAISSKRQAPRAAEAGSAEGRATEIEAPVAATATVFDPLAAAKASEHVTLSSADSAKTTFDPLAAAKAEELEVASRAAVVEAPVAGKTIAATRVSDEEAPRASGVAALTPHRLGTGPKPASPTIDGELDPRAAVEASPVAASVPAPERAQVTRDEEPARKPLVAKAPAPRSKVSFLRRPALVGGVAAVVAAAAATGLYLRDRTPHTEGPVAPAPWSGTVASVARASADKAGGLEACDSAGACAPLEGGAAVRAGSTLRTDARTRAFVTLSDGTELSIDRGSAVKLSGDKDRSAWIKQGTIVADVTHVDGATARFGFPHGEVEVLGTKLSITASEERASVEVARGVVRLSGENGKSVEVRAGEEATMLRGRDAVVASSSSIADMMEWSDKKPEEIDAPVLRGLGELRARKPGQTKEKDHAVRLAKHAVKVRVVDIVARTEVDETFANDTDEELEGIFRFPLPPGAQIERLALEVDGKLMEGAFVDRDKGAAIWRGVIQNAAPKAPKPRDEIIWVPGPWRDPALLEWQRGGRFELKIFPIPKRGSRRVILTYTQTVEQAAGIRRFTYPLAHDPSGTTKVDAFDLDLQVLGLDKSVGLQTRGYDLQSASGEGDRRTMHADGFVPAGDLTVEYALPDRDKEVTAWAYSMSGSVERPEAAPSKAKPLSADEKLAVDNAAAILSDGSPYVAIALRPKLPRWQEAKERVHAIVVDASRSMFGERFARARTLASSIVREMDRRDSFVLLACDTVCRPMSDERGGSARPEAPGAAAAEKVERFLGQIEPDGGSDLGAAVNAARSAVGGLAGKELRVLYLGDGTPSVGPTRASHLETAVRSSMPPGDGAVIAVALGADADMPSLGAMARGGGGVVVPYVPGQKVSTAALEVLGAAYGVVLRDAEVELPAGLSQVSPARLDPIRAGGETLLVARMSGGDKVSGTVKLKGRVAGEKFEQSYPLEVVASTNGGNAFVPRLFAAAKIAELEQSGGQSQKPTVIELSKRFAVASRFTSLLVLESEAMFKAFGLDRHSSAPSFTGEIQALSSSADAEGEPEEAADAPGLRDKDSAGVGRREAGLEKKKHVMDELDGLAAGDLASNEDLGRLGASRGGGGFASPPAATAAPTMPPAPQGAAAKPAPMDPFAESEFPSTRPPAKVAGPSPGWRRPPPPPPPRRLVPMRRVFDRKLAFDAQNGFVTQNSARLAAAESALAGSPDSRDKTVELYSLFATSGRLNEAQELTARWSGRDALDPDALIARADLAARQGDRERAVRILGGLADVRPNDRAIQTRLVELHEAAGNNALACEHRLALADMASGDAKLVADAVRCARTQGLAELASAFRLDAADKVRDAIDRLLDAPLPAPAGLRGDVQVSAEWTGGADLDLAIIDAQGKRSSWLGGSGKVTTTVRDATSTRAESLALLGLPQGSYVVEIARAGGGSDSANTPIRGEVTLRLAGEVRKVPFTLTGARAELGTVRVSFTSRLVPVEGGNFGWQGLR